MRQPQDALRSLKRYAAHVLGEEWEVRLWDEPGTFNRPFARVARAGPVLSTNRVHFIEYAMPCAIHLYPREQQTIEAGIAAAEAAEQTLADGFELGVSYTERLPPPEPTIKSQVPDPGGVPAGPHFYGFTTVTKLGESEASVLEFTTGAASILTFGWEPVGGALHYRVYKGTDENDAVLIGQVEPEIDEGFGPLPVLEATDDGQISQFGGPMPLVSSADIVRKGHPRRFPLYDHAAVPWEGAFADTNARFENDYVRVLDLSTNRLHDPVDERLISVVCDIRCGWRRLGRVPSGTNITESVQVTESVLS